MAPCPNCPTRPFGDAASPPGRCRLPGGRPQPSSARVEVNLRGATKNRNAFPGPRQSDVEIARIRILPRSAITTWLYSRPLTSKARDAMRVTSRRPVLRNLSLTRARRCFARICPTARPSRLWGGRACPRETYFRVIRWRRPRCRYLHWAGCRRYPKVGQHIRHCK